MKYINYDRKQQSIFGYCVEDFAKRDPKSRFVVELVNKLDLNVLHNRYSTQGNHSYPPDVLLALWFYAYSNGISSTRKLEELCKFDLRYMYISGGLEPDHSTLSRFRKDNLDLVSQYFIEIILKAKVENISEFDKIAIDGTKIRSKSSTKHHYNESQLSKQIENIKKEIELYMSLCDSEERGESYSPEEREKLSRLKEKEKELTGYQRELAERKSKIRPQHRKNHGINIKEPDAHIMHRLGESGYNGQIAVDEDSQLIVAQDVTTDRNDQKQFIPMVEKVNNTVGSMQKRTFVADGGYHNIEILEEVERRKIDAIIADPNPSNRSTKSKPSSMEVLLRENRRLKRKDFSYDPEEDVYHCPAGHRLCRYRNKGDKIIYRSTGDCASCPLHNQCVWPGKKVKQIQRLKKEGISERHAKKLRTEYAKERMRKRKITVEPVFGILKQNLGFIRFSMAGLPKVKGEFTLMCIGYNINVLLKMVMKGKFPGFDKLFKLFLAKFFLNLYKNRSLHYIYS